LLSWNCFVDDLAFLLSMRSNFRDLQGFGHWVGLAVISYAKVASSMSLDSSLSRCLRVSWFSSRYTKIYRPQTE